jgi:release factor glutamine methyltransferase
LAASGIDTAAFDAMSILKHCFAIERHELVVIGQKQAEKEGSFRFFKLISQRAKGRPLQYILGKWDFMGELFEVGEGVFIPREDTEVLFKTAAAFIEKKKSPQILELCAGSGIISIMLAINFPGAKITCLEIFEEAIYYLNKNIKNFSDDFHGPADIKVVNGDLFSEEIMNKLGLFDLIVCNPPYIPSGEIPHLQKEVQNEPLIALDGGPDGLDFYHILTKKWKSHINKFGALAVEIGKGQAKPVSALFENAGFKNIVVKRDISGIERTITGFII